MADDTSTQQPADGWPTVKFQFLVQIGNAEAHFQEVTGLNAETQQIEYRKANSPVFSTIKMPGIQKFGNVTLKKGIFKDDKMLWEMYQAVKMNAQERSTITISLLDETGGVAMSWALANAHLSKITVTEPEAAGNRAVVETIEIAHEGFSVA